MNKEDLETYLRIKKELSEDIMHILEYHPERFDTHYACCKGCDIEVPALPVNDWYIFDDYEDKGKHVVFVTLGPPPGYEGEHEFHFPIEWILDKKLHDEVYEKFKKLHDEMQKRENEEYNKRQKVCEYEKQLEQEHDEEREQKIKEFKDSL